MQKVESIRWKKSRSILIEYVSNEFLKKLRGYHMREPIQKRFTGSRETELCFENEK